MEQRWEAGRGRDSSCWKQFWLGEGFLIPLLHTGSAAAANIRRAVPPKAEYPLPRLLLNSSRPCFSMQQDPFCRGWNSYNRRRCQQQSSLPLGLSHPCKPHASNVGTHCKPCYVSPLIGFRWLPFPSLHYVKGAVLCCAKSLRSCPTLWDPMDCSLPGSSVHGDSPGKNTGVGYAPPPHAVLQGIFPTEGLNLCLLPLLHWLAGSLPLTPPRKV